MTSSMPSQLSEAAAQLRQKINSNIDLFLIAGSGFRDALPTMDDVVTVPMSDVTNLPTPSVSGHGGEFRFGRIGAKRILVATGRVHLYEGYSAQQVVFAVRMAKLLECRGVVLTNAAGSVDRRFPPGTLTVIKDQINLTGQSCEAGGGDGPAVFTDMTHCYDKEWREKFSLSLKMPQSVYAGVIGPAYETTAEARMLSVLGAHVVGMSTVQECIAARTMGLKVFGLSLVTNMAGGLGGPILHSDVLKLANTRTAEISKALNCVVDAFG